MKRINTYLLIGALLLSVAVVSSCSTKKNTLTSRSYHNLVSRYNIYFNGREALKAGEQKIETDVSDDYSRILPVYKASLPETENIVASNMDYAIEKSNKLIGSHSITVKPKRRKSQGEAYKKLANKEEYNNWVDDSHLLSGKAYYYLKDYIKAADEFDYVLRKFPEKPKVYYSALIWLLRSYTAIPMTEQAMAIIGEIEGSLQFPKGLNATFDMAAADFYLRQDNTEKAISHLEQAVASVKDKGDRARCHYILAQLYAQAGRNQSASIHFEEVTKLRVPYMMRFSARLSSLALSVNDENLAAVQAELRKLARLERNREFRDQIFYALAQTELRTHNEPKAIGYLRQSAAAYEDNDNQLVLTCSTLSDLYYKRQEYIDSRMYYDTLFTVISSTHADYGQLSARHKGLVNLTDNLLVVEREDSLQRLALMDEGERNKLVSRWAQQKETQKQLEAAKEQQQASNAMLAVQLSNTQNQSTWYFYNQQTVALGKQQFLNNWGKRRQEDGWRRGNKGMSMVAEESAEDLANDSGEILAGQEARITDNTRADFYLQDMPRTPEDFEASNERILDALFRAGRIFKHDFNNLHRSSNTLEDLLARFPTNQYQLPVYFELWDSYQKLSNQERADYYKSLILSQYPKSKYAQYLSNPNYFIELEEQREKTEKAFADALTLYQKGRHAQAAQRAKHVLSMQPDSALIPSLQFIQLIGENKTKDKKSFDAALAAYAQENPASGLATLADNIRALLQDDSLQDYQAMLASGYISEDIIPQEKEVADRQGYSREANLIHYFVLAFDNDSAVDVNRLRFDLANYNIDHYLKTDFDMESVMFSAKKSMLLVKSFLDKEQALIYMRSIIRQPVVFNELKAKNYHNFVISSENYRRLTEMGNLDEYLIFFKQYYSQFTSGNFPEEEMPSPEELMEQLQKQKEAPKETGTFVVVGSEEK